MTSISELKFQYSITPSQSDMWSSNFQAPKIELAKMARASLHSLLGRRPSELSNTALHVCLAMVWQLYLKITSSCLKPWILGLVVKLRTVPVIPLSLEQLSWRSWPPLRKLSRVTSEGYMDFPYLHASSSLGGLQYPSESQPPQPSCPPKCKHRE